MTPLATTLLAADDYDLVIKVVVFLVIGVIWAVSQLISWLGTQKDKTFPPSRSRTSPQQQRTPAQRGPGQRGPAHRTQSQQAPPDMPSRPPPLQRRQDVPPVLQRPPTKRPQKQKARPVAVPVPVAAPVAVPVPASQGSRTQTRVDAATTHAYDARPQRDDPPKRDETLPRRQVLEALLRPRNLRKAFIVTELLGPPVALRPRVPSPGTPGEG